MDGERDGWMEGQMGIGIDGQNERSWIQELIEGNLMDESKIDGWIDWTDGLVGEDGQKEGSWFKELIDEVILMEKEMDGLMNGWNEGLLDGSVGEDRRVS